MGFSLGSLSIDPITASINAATNLAGAYTSYQSAKKSNNAAKSINETQLAYNKEAAQNAHQWEVQDLQQAGLNPILSAGGNGASANPMTAVMPDTSGYQTAGNHIAQAITTGADAIQKLSQADLANAETDFTKGVKSEHTASEITKNQENSKLMQSQAKQQQAQAQLALSTIGLQSAETALKQQQEYTEKQKQWNYIHHNQLMDAQRDVIKGGIINKYTGADEYRARQRHFQKKGNTSQFK